MKSANNFALREDGRNLFDTNSEVGNSQTFFDQI